MVVHDAQYRQREEVEGICIIQLRFYLSSHSPADLIADFMEDLVVQLGTEYIRV